MKDHGNPDKSMMDSKESINSDESYQRAIQNIELQNLMCHLLNHIKETATMQAMM